MCIEFDRTRLEVEFKCLDRVGVRWVCAVFSHEVREGEIAVCGLPFGQVDGIVETDMPAGCQASPGVSNEVEAVGDVEVGPQQGRRHDRARVDHRIVRQPGRVERELVEHMPAGLAADVLVDEIRPVLVEGEAVVDRLTHRLQREVDVCVAEVDRLPVGRACGHGEQLRINAAELRDVLGDLATVHFADDLEDLTQLASECREVGDDQVAGDGTVEDAVVTPGSFGETREPDQAVCVAFGVELGQHRLDPRVGLPQTRVGQRLDDDARRDRIVGVRPKRIEPRAVSTGTIMLCIPSTARSR